MRRFVVGICWLLGCLSGCADDAPPLDDDSPRAGSGGSRHAPDDAGSPDRDAATADAAGPSLPDLCSGCEGEDVDVGDNAAHFHHVHLNTADLAESRAFYERVFGTVEVRLNDEADVEKADGALVLMEPVETEPSDTLAYGIEHVGWGSTDVNAWFMAALEKDIRVDQRSGMFDRPFELLPDFFFVYLQGPSNERIEINTADHDEFGHVHFMTDDVDATVAWYEALLDVEATMPEAAEANFDAGGMPVAWTSNSILIDKVDMIFFGPPYPVPEAFEPTEDGPINHIAFCFADLDPIVERVAALDVEVVAEAAADEQYGFRSLFVRAPDRVLVELVEAPAIPNPFPSER